MLTWYKPAYSLQRAASSLNHLLKVTHDPHNEHSEWWLLLRFHNAAMGEAESSSVMLPHWP